MTDFDPLGRLAAHGVAPYPHPAVSEKTMTTYWRDLYRPEAEAIGADLATEYERAVGAVAECEAAIEAAKDAWERWQRQFPEIGAEPDAGHQTAFAGLEAAS